MVHRRGPVSAQQAGASDATAGRVGELLAGLSHDLRSPLFAVATAAELIDRSLDDPGGSARLRRVSATLRRSVERLRQLADDLSDLAGLESGTLVLARQPVDVTALARELHEACRSAAEESSITLAVDAEPGLPPASWDRERLGRALAHLLHECLRATASRGALEVSFRRRAGGIGICAGGTDAAPGPRLLVPRPANGPRLDLVRAIVVAHGGSVESLAPPAFALSLPAA
jgi:signal transduction histidine kinase